MFNIGGTELILILVIAFVVVGPKDLPRVARALGRAVRMIRQMINELKAETGMDELEREFKGVATELKSAETDVKESMKQADITPEFRDATREVGKEISSVKKELSFKEYKQQQMGGNKS